MDRIPLLNKTIFKVTDSVKMGDAIVPCVYGPLSDTELVSSNGYRYRNSFWRTVINHESIQDRIESREMLGMIEHPVDDEEYLRTPYKKASHVVLGVTIKDSVPFGKFGLLNNTEGNVIKSLVDLNVPVGVSTRGLGSFIKDDVSEFVDEDNYVLITWDFTNNPNLKNAIMEKVSDSMKSIPRYKELLEMYQIRDDEGSSRTRNLISDMEKILAELRKEL